jgi:methyl-accepting chemotaxis protein
LNNLKIGTRLGVLSAILLLSIIAIGLIGWTALGRFSSVVEASLDRAAELESMVNTSRHAQVQFKTQVQEWKNILLRGGDQASFEKHKAAFIKEGANTQASMEKLKAAAQKSGFDTAPVASAQKALSDLQVKYLEALKEFDAAKPESPQVVDKLVRGMDREPSKKLDEIVGAVAAFSDAHRVQIRSDGASSYKLASAILLAAVAAATIIGVLLTRVLVLGITRPLDKAVRVARTVASGDLSSQISPRGKDEVADLMQAMHQMNESLIRIVSDVRSGTDTIASTSIQISDGSGDLSARTEQQASALEETASSMEELISTVKQNADNAMAANGLASEAADVARRGGAVVNEVVATMDSINASSRKIVDIISVIDGIAFQTNILALNAAVEAARAGEQGRGFAVVASEVRNLAQRSAAAAKEIKSLISDSVEKVDAGTRLVSNAGSTMEEVVASVQRVRDLIGDIANASQEQAIGIGQVNEAIAQLEETTQRNVALVEESTASAQALQEQAAKLSDVVGVFKN